MNMEMYISALLPEAVRWVEKLEGEALASGRSLDSAEIELATRMGVSNPERVRILEVPTIPSPDTPALAEAVEMAGLMGAGVQGLTLGHSIYVIEGCLTTLLLSHELVHVAQYERYGSIDAFINEYLKQYAEHGYKSMPLEKEAYNRQVSDWPPED